MKKGMAGIVVLAGMVLMGACGKQEAAVSSDAAATEETAAVENAEISVVGSTTVQPLAELFSEGFEAIHPNVTITVSGGGSSVGVKSASEQTADIGMASREIKDSELQECPELVIHTVARDGIAIVVNDDVDVNDLTMEQVRGIFSGSITDWGEVGGTPGAITVVAREEGSGTRAAFEELAMGDELISENAILQPSNGAVRTTIASTPGAIGFLSFGYLDESTKSLAIDGVPPSTENVAAGTYPLVRPLNMMTYGQPTGAVAEWLDFILGEDGQAIVVAEGYLPVN